MAIRLPAALPASGILRVPLFDYDVLLQYVETPEEPPVESLFDYDVLLQYVETEKRAGRLPVVMLSPFAPTRL